MKREAETAKVLVIASLKRRAGARALAGGSEEEATGEGDGEGEGEDTDLWERIGELWGEGEWEWGWCDFLGDGAGDWAKVEVMRNRAVSAISVMGREAIDGCGERERLWSWKGVLWEMCMGVGDIKGGR